MVLREVILLQTFNFFPLKLTMRIFHTAYICYIPLKRVHLLGRFLAFLGWLFFSLFFHLTEDFILQLQSLLWSLELVAFGLGADDLALLFFTHLLIFIELFCLTTVYIFPILLILLLLSFKQSLVGFPKMFLGWCFIFFGLLPTTDLIHRRR